MAESPTVPWVGPGAPGLHLPQGLPLPFVSLTPGLEVEDGGGGHCRGCPRPNRVGVEALGRLGKPVPRDPQGS